MATQRRDVWAVILGVAIGCNSSPPQCKTNQRYDLELRMCLGICGTREEPAAPQCYDLDAGNRREAGTNADDGSNDSSFTSDGAVDGRDATFIDAVEDGALIDDPSVAAPRAVAPLSTSSVTSQRPTLRWQNAVAVDGAVVELSRTRDFRVVEHRLDAVGTSVRPASALAAGVWFWRLRGRNSARSTVGTPRSAIWWFRVGARSADADRDRSWGTELDVNGDGYGDVAVGSPSADSSQGRVDVFYGGPTGIGSTPSVTLRGSEPRDSFGFSLASAGDLNGDGFADLAVGAYRAAPSGRIEAGTVSVYYGSSSGLPTSPSVVLEGAGATDAFGCSVSSAGDVNGDGFADLLVGAIDASPALRSHAGTASLFLGSAEGVMRMPARVLEGPSDNAQFGQSVTGIGDVNGDGFGDIAVAAPAVNAGGAMRSGAVLVYRGSAMGLEVSPAQVLSGSSADDAFGTAIAGIGDINGDGLADFVVAAPRASRAGRSLTGVAVIYLGNSAGTNFGEGRTYEGAMSNSGLGAAVSGIGDANNDGFSDWGITSFRMAAGGAGMVGVVQVFHGAVGNVAMTPAQLLEHPMAADTFGASLSSAGDVDGDGFLDLVVGAPGANSASVHRGSTTGITAAPVRVLVGTTMFGEFGRAVAHATNKLRVVRRRS
ncbi:MAG: integrin alpha [Polyangiales bacterium]